MEVAITDTSGFILAGGKSSRMGFDKAFLEICGKTLLEHAVDKLKPFCSRVFIVLSDVQESFPCSAELMFDILKGRGALGGIHTSLRNCKSEFAFILAVDLPLIRHETIKTLIVTIKEDPKADAVVPIEFKRKFDETEKDVSGSRLQPLCAVYRAEKCLPIVEEILHKKKKASVHDFLKLISVRILKFTDEEFLNVNTQKDYEEVLRIWQKQ
ncbi:MAG: molybdenum cofactor guanylyltransferase [Acidobacteria bacterium]|jgi:molybdopterin-guanine dinucleotide biosynthesis protein A|nr:MAG: molybdenum cofactor guanylyltransferase [Acidobacteriota bacterium]GIU81163.1 MAG: putative molybdenum cofactor guanylyltransferase [Pyrinomonadaceae bacterium]